MDLNKNETAKGASLSNDGLGTKAEITFDDLLEYDRRIEAAFWNGGGQQGFAFKEVARILAEFNFRIKRLEENGPNVPIKGAPKESPLE